MAPVGKSRRMRPHDIRFTQDSIGSRFTDGSYLSDTFEELLNRRLSVDQLDAIEVVKDRSLYWALTGNRRLYLYRKLEDLGEVRTIPVVEMFFCDYGVSRRFENRNTTTCEGLDIEMRQPQAERHINRAIERWKASRPHTQSNLNEISGVHTSRHLPTAAAHQATSIDRNNSNTAIAPNRERMTTWNDSDIVITTQPFTSTGFGNSTSEMFRQGPSRRSVQTSSNSAAEPGSIRSVARGSISSVQPGPERPACTGHRSKLNDAFYEGCGPSPVASSTARSGYRRTPFPTNLFSNNSAETGAWIGAGVGRRRATEEDSGYGRTSFPTNLDSNNSAETGAWIGAGVGRRGATEQDSGYRRTPFPTNLDSNNSAETRAWIGAGVGRRGAAEQDSGREVVTCQPQGSRDPIMVSDEAGCSCCSCCLCCSREVSLEAT